MKFLNAKRNNFQIEINKFLLTRKNKIKLNSGTVSKIIKDVKKMEIKPYLNMKKNIAKIAL